MTDATPARVAALDVLRAVRRGALADRVLARALERLPARERPWTQELVYGTLRLRGRLDHLLDRQVRRGIGSLEPDVLDVLRLGLYQLLEMRSVPAYAAVSQSVELARRAGGGRGADRLVNGVLQALKRRMDEIGPPPFEGDPEAYLTSWGSHPAWLVRRWIERYGADGARALVEANNRRPELFIRPAGPEREAAPARLEEAGIDAEPVDFAPDAIRIVPPTGAAEVLDAVPAIVQDPAAGLVARYAMPPPGARVGDLCAAPGGKAVALAESAEYVVAADVSRERMRRLEENLARIGGLPVGLVVADARQPPFRDEAFELVLLDVPCTGTGTFRRHPDARWRVRPHDLETLTALQRVILDAAASLVAPGGWLVYSTCSLEPEENEAQVDTFLDRHAAFRDDPDPAAGLEPELLDGAGRLRVLPQSHGVDGAFAARLRRSVEA